MPVMGSSSVVFVSLIVPQGYGVQGVRAAKRVQPPVRRLVPDLRRLYPLGYD
jgi:hypothetical protein